MAIITVWLSIILYPYFYLPIKIKDETLSNAISKNRNFTKVLSLGLFISGALSAVFSNYLISRFSLLITMPTIILYISMSFVTILAAFFNPSKYKKIHLSIATYYFWISPLMMLTFGATLAHTPEKIAFIASYFCFLLYIIGVTAIMFWTKKVKNTLLEIWAFFILLIWVLIMTFI
ncbi:MAG: hypothetical protein WC790_02525 [Candidatus Paceibacterota bacterium]